MTEHTLYAPGPATAARVVKDGETWRLEPAGGGTRLTLWTNLDRRFMAGGAAGWQICCDVMERLLDGHPIGRIAGPEAMKFEGWQRLTAAYTQQFREA